MIFRLGSGGPHVGRLQQRLKELGLYLGPVDDRFGGGTESAVKRFQRIQGLQADGIVDPRTWGALLDGEPVPALDLLTQPVAQRCLMLTGSFETARGAPECYAALSGDFDGQGISLGALEWNLRQRTLQALLEEMTREHRALMEDLFNEQLPVLLAMLKSPPAEQMAWARSIQDRRFQVLEPWRGLLKALGRTPEFQTVQLRYAARIHGRSLEMCATYELTTERAAALMFDISVQNGSIGALVRAQIEKDFAALPKLEDPLQAEVARMRIIATRRAAACRPEFVEEVRARKLTIAEGQGVVHGIPYDLEQQFALRLLPLEPS
jgi:hypothetical protein